MPEFRILWTALPRGVDGTDLLVDAFVAPRLGVDAPAGSEFTLADFPPFEDWPRQIADHLAFDVEFSASGTPVGATRVPLPPSDSDVDLDSVTWSALFPPSTRVNPWSLRSVADRPFYSYPADQLAEYLRTTYQAAGTGPDGTLDDDLDQIVEDAGDLIDTRPGDERAEPTSRAQGGETTGGGPPAGRPGCFPGCLFAPLAWVVWIVRWLWHQLIGGPAPGPAPTSPASPPPPISATPIEVTYETPPRPAAAVPAALAAVEGHVATAGVTPPADWTPGGGVTKQAVALASAWRFYNRPESAPTKYDLPDASKVPPSPVPPDWDFHQRLGVLGDYPLLMRRLGLVIRLRVPAPASAPTSVRIVPKWDGQPLPARDLTPRTRCVVDGARFMPETRPGSEYKDGVVDLTGVGESLAAPDGYRVLAVDADGAVLKLIHTAASLVRYRWMRTRKLVQDESRAEGLSSLRTAGLAIVRRDRAVALRKHIVALRDDALATPQRAPDELWADDIVRGFAVEVQDVTTDPSAPWRSLCGRKGRYFVLDDGGAILDSFDLDDEGYVKRSGATSADDKDSPLYVHETVVRWDGWSLVVPRPGRVIRDVPGTRIEPDGRVVPTQDEKVVAPVPEPLAQLHLATVFQSPPGQLPKLRIGNAYRLRLPWVDLAGERIRPIADSAPATVPVMYRRFEPVAPPVLLPLEPYTPGESLETLVIRSTVDQPASTYVSTVLEPADSTMEWRATASRHVFPPKVTQEQAEQHGMLDSYLIEPRWRASLRADNTLDNPSLVDIDDGTTPIPFGSPGSVVIEPSQAAIDGMQERYAVNAADETLPTPYLPDPFAQDAAFRQLPSAELLPAAGTFVAADLPVDPPRFKPPPTPPPPEKIVHVPFSGNWPVLDSFRIRVAERPGSVDPATGVTTFDHPSDPPAWDPVARVMTVFLAKGEVVDVPFSSRPSKTHLGRMGAAEWLRTPSLPNAVSQMELGAHWLTSPSRTLRLVHAVQRPLRPADLLPLAPPDKAVGSTLAKVHGTALIDPRTTGQVTLVAEWTDETDDGAGPALLAVDAHVVLETFTVPLDLAVPAAGADFPPDPQMRALHEFGDTRHRMVSYWLKASTRFREFFPPGLAGPTAADESDGFSRAGAKQVVSIRNSAPPIAPAIRYVMPSYGWDTPDPTPATAWVGFTRRRVGGGVRVFLDRPWFLSGPGEQLGVVLAPAGIDPIETRHTMIGVDPTRGGLFTPQVPHIDPSMFTGGTVTPGVVLEDLSTVDVVGYVPELDLVRNQWFVDVTVDMDKLPNMYGPFVRLALVRFQPQSVETAHASKIVLAEFAQLAPDRELTVTVSGNQVNVIVRGRGPEHGTPNRMIIALDEGAGVDPDELAWRPVGSPAGAADLGDDLLTRVAGAVAAATGPGGPRWEQTLQLPGPRGDRPLRVIVREVEFRPADRDGTTGQGEVPIVAADTARLIPRIVYADAVRLA
jgi:hypothetical protein